MKKLSTAIFFFLLLILIFVLSFTAYYISAKTPSPQKSEAIEDKIIKTEFVDSKPKENKVSFLLKASNGKLILYKEEKDGTSVVLEEYDIDISLLPKEDRRTLSEGIQADTLNDALQLIEDFSG